GGGFVVCEERSLRRKRRSPQGAWGSSGCVEHKEAARARHRVRRPPSPTRLPRGKREILYGGVSPESSMRQALLLTHASNELMRRCLLSGYCWRTPKCRKCASPMPSLKAQEHGESKVATAALSHGNRFANSIRPFSLQ